MSLARWIIPFGNIETFARRRIHKLRQPQLGWKGIRRAFGQFKKGTVMRSDRKRHTMQCAAQSIRVNAIAPGAVLIERVKKLMEQDNDSGPTQDMIAKHLLGLGHPQQVATVVLFFASEDSNWITGQVLPVDGGASVH